MSNDPLALFGVTALSPHFFPRWYLPFVSQAKLARFGEALFPRVTGASSGGAAELRAARVTGSALDADPIDGVDLRPGVPRIVNQCPPQGELGAYRRHGNMSAVAGHQLHHEVPRGLLLIGEQLPVLPVGGELVVYISVFGQVLR